MKTIKGSLLALAMIAMALGLAVINTWYQRSLTHQTQSLWGNEVSLLIAAAPRAELLRLGPAVQAVAKQGPAAAVQGEVVLIGKVAWPIVDSRVMADDDPPMLSRGFENLRHSLRQDASYAWGERAKSDPPVWRYVLRFSDENHGDKKSVAILVFSADSRIARDHGNEQATLIPRIGEGLMKFAEEKFAEAAIVIQP